MLLKTISNKTADYVLAADAENTAYPAPTAKLTIKAFLEMIPGYKA